MPAPGLQIRAAAYWWAKLPDTDRKALLERVGDRLVERFKTYLKALEEASGVINAPPREQLAIFRIRPETAWTMLRQYFPKDYQGEMNRWAELEEEYGDDPDVAAIMEVMHARPA